MNLKRLLEKRKIRQVDLVRALSVDPARVSLLTNGVRLLPEKYLRQVCDLLDVSMGDLLASFRDSRKSEAKKLKARSAR